MVPVALGRASVLYTFYPPLIGSAFYYIGVVLVVVGSWIWVALMSVNLRVWRRDTSRTSRCRSRCSPTSPDPISGPGPRSARRSNCCCRSFRSRSGWRTTIDAGLARVFFSWTLHAIVYFWLMPTYIAYYTIVPRAIGGRLYSDTMGRIAFILFLVVAMPIGIHHTFADPQVGAGFKFIHSAFTALVALPTLLTVFTICASVEIAARLRGGRGPFGWIAALPWDNPDHAGGRVLVRPARLRRRRRAHQHELSARHRRSTTRSGSPATST